MALITDAGMPLVSDPGGVLVKLLIENNLEYTVVPGPSACISALALGGLEGDRFTFLGFLPEKKGEREKFLAKYKELDTTLVFYVAPHDLKDTVRALYAAFGERKAVAVKEITKLHERRTEFFLSQGFPEEAKGEYVLLVSGAEEKENALNALSEKEHIEYYKAQGLSTMDALKAVAKDRKVSKSSLYKYTLEE